MQGSAHPRSIDEIFIDFQNRKTGLRLALTDEQEVFYRQCDPQKENLCLYGEPDGRWVVDLPAEEVPPELPEPCLGINFARDGMKRSDWLSLVAVHSDAWLVSVAFYYGAKLDANGRMQLYRLINNEPTLYELVTGKHLRNRFDYPGGAVGPTGMRTEGASAPLPHGRLLTHADINLNLRGRRAELFWPDDNLWYMVEIHSINPRSRQAKIQYSSGEFEDLDLQEIIREGHCSLVHI